MGKPLQVLNVEDSPDDALLLQRHIERAGCDVTFVRVDTREAMLTALQTRSFDVVIADYVLPKFSALAALALLKEHGYDLPFIVLSGAIGEDIAVEAMRAGAHDYLMKGQLTRLVPAIEREMQEAANRRERRRAEELALRLGRILDSSSNEVYIFDAESFRFTQANHGACRNLGYSLDELRQLTPCDLSADFCEAQLDALTQPLRTGARDQVVFETTHCRKDGSVYPVEVRLHFSRLETPPSYVAIALDITERKKAEEALRFLADASKELASSLDYEKTLNSVARLAVPRLADFCAIDVLLDIADPRAGFGTRPLVQQTAVAHVNPELAELVREARQHYPLDLSADHPIANVLRDGRSVLVSEVTPDWPGTIARNDDHLAFLQKLAMRSVMVVPLMHGARVLGSVTFVTSESGRCYGPDDLALAEELARRAALATENSQLYRQVQQALRTRDEFLITVSHDLKTPLTAIKGYAQMLHRQASRLNQTGVEQILHGSAAIDATATKMTTLINELLDVARLQMGQPLELDRRPFDLLTLTRQVAEAHQQTTTMHRIAIHSEVGELIGAWDNVRIERVLANLIGNAVKYSPSGGTITVTLGREGDDDSSYAVIRVQDEGLGIPTADLPHIFERFHRATNVAGKIRGTGIGLTSARHIVEQHGGTIAVESREGFGSTFTVRLPLLKAEPNGDATSTPGEGIQLRTAPTMA